MATGWTNPCGGLRWRTLSDGAIEVERLGVVMPPPGEGKYSYRTYVKNSWRNFEPEIRRAAKKHGVPLTWILAITATETGINSSTRRKQSGVDKGIRCPSVCCYGPMAVMVCPYPNHKTFGGYARAEDMLDPWRAIDTGTAIMKHWMKKGYELPSISARYNSGGHCCRNSPAVASKPGGRQQNEFNLCSAKIAGTSYPMMSTFMNNYAIRELGIRETSTLRTLAYAGAGALVIGSLGFALVTLLPD
jgi:hypothetical protein